MTNGSTTEPGADTRHDPASRIAAVTGASGYIGGRLVPALLDDGWQVRVLTRNADSLAGQAWRDDAQVVTGDASDPAALANLLDGANVAYYLLHSMDGQGDFARRDRELAETFAAAAASADLPRVVYLSGLHPSGPLSPHLDSRVEVGEVFLDGAVPAAVLQAGVVLGAGSASFDMLRHLTERLPAMIAPKWLHNEIQPIAVDDVMHYLVRAATLPPKVNRTFDIGGPEVLTYAEMIRRYAKVVGLRPPVVATVPVLTPSLASHWVGLVTPVSAGIAKPLVGSLVHDAVCHEHDLADLVGEPDGGATGFDEAVRRAVADLDPRQWRRRAVRVVAGAAGVAGLAATGLLTRRSRTR